MTLAEPQPSQISHIEMPRNNPTDRWGREVPREGENGLFTQSWFPICLSSDVEAGAVIGRDFLDGKVVVFRGEDGVARVMSAFCPHVGADLSVGCVVENRLQCAFHKWEFDAYGDCAKTAIGDPAPEKAKLFKFPSQERFGMVWAFNGNEPLWDLPDFEYPDSSLVMRSYQFEDPFQCDPWVFAANTPDMQHIKAVHLVRFHDRDPHDLVEWTDWGFRYKFDADHQGDVPISWTVGIRGTSLFWQEGTYGDIWLGGLVGFGLPCPGQHEVFAALAIVKSNGSSEDLTKEKEIFDMAEQLMHRTINEDKDILNTIHYHPGTLTKGDRTLSKYLTFLRDYPRAHPSKPFIR